MLPIELWRKISLFLETPYYIYNLNKSMTVLKSTSNTWILPQYIKNHLIGSGDTSELYNIYKWYYEIKSPDTICELIRELSDIVDNIYCKSSRITSRYTGTYKQRRLINIKKLKVIINDNINTIMDNHLLIDRSINKFIMCKTHEVYRLPPIVMNCMKRHGGMLQIKALIY